MCIIPYPGPLVRLQTLHLQPGRELRRGVLVSRGKDGRAQGQAHGRPAQLDLQDLFGRSLHEDRGEELRLWLHLEV